MSEKKQKLSEEMMEMRWQVQGEEAKDRGEPVGVKVSHWYENYNENNIKYKGWSTYYGDYVSFPYI